MQAPGDDNDNGHFPSEEEIAKALEEIHPGYWEFLEDFQKKVEDLDRFRRKQVSITLAEPVFEAIDKLRRDFRDDEGKPYPFSYFIEDIVTFVLRNPLIYFLFLAYFLGEEDEEET